MLQSVLWQTAIPAGSPRTGIGENASNEENRCYAALRCCAAILKAMLFPKGAAKASLTALGLNTQSQLPIRSHP